MSSLFERLLGGKFHDLAHVLRQFHGAGSHGHARGRLAVEHGPGRAARLTARFMGLPDESPQTDVELQMTGVEAHEIWDRTFGSKTLRSRVWACDGRLIEAVGPLRLGFRLQVEEGGLDFLQERTWLWGIPLPKWLAPRAEAHIQPAGERWRIEMRLSQPQLGLIVYYHGTMAPAPPEASMTKPQ